MIAREGEPGERAGERSWADGGNVEGEREVERRRPSAAVTAIAAGSRDLIEAGVGGRNGPNGAVRGARRAHGERAAGGAGLGMAAEPRHGSAEREDDELDREQRERERSSCRAGVRRAAVAGLHS